MNIPGFNAEASLGTQAYRYQANPVFDRSGSGKVLPMLPRRPTVDNQWICFQGAGEHSCDGLLCTCCYDDGCWICDNYGGLDIPTNCVWDDSYRTQPKGPRRPLPDVFTGFRSRLGGLRPLSM
jgi:hypothetical protein